MNARDLARRLRFGQIWLTLYHRPIGRIRQSLRNGGPLAERETERQRREMEAAAHHLPPLPDYPKSTPVTLHLMTGKRFWYQTAFCLHTFCRHAGVTTNVELYDDGTIDDACAALLRRLGPTIKIHFASELRQRCENLLPTARFPTLRDRYIHYPNIRKLIDMHLGSDGWKLVIDSDLLFFRRPDVLLSWLANPTALLHAIDCEESYGYSKPLLERLAGGGLPTRLNVGICGLRSEALNWTELEAWTAELQQKEKTNYYLEQALVAMLASRETRLAAPALDYITMPTRHEVMAPRAIMHHYVDTSKRWYFRYGWRQALASCS